MKIKSTEDLMSVCRRLIASVESEILWIQTKPFNAEAVRLAKNARITNYREFKATFERIEKEISE